MIIPDTTTFEKLLNYFSFVAWMFYGVTMFSVIWLRIRKPNLNRPFKVSDTPSNIHLVRLESSLVFFFKCFARLDNFPRCLKFGGQRACATPYIVIFPAAP